MMMRPRLLALACALYLANPAAAQSGATKSLGGAMGSGKLLTREQLRICLAQQKDLAARKGPLEAGRARLERERKSLDEGAASLDALRAEIDRFRTEADDIRRRGTELAQKIADFNERARKIQEPAAAGPMAERQRQSLEREKAALDKASKDLESDRAGLAARAEPAAKAYNEQLEQRNRVAADWNASRTQFSRGAQAYESELADWKTDCEGRPYREDDEKAILSGG
jgi:predicted  nucleic acid-binding Zn-ribbon protein